MRYEILHDIPGRIRVHCLDFHINEKNAAAIGEILSLQEGFHSADLSVRTGNLLITYSRIVPRRHVVAVLDVLSPSDWHGFGEYARMPSPPLFELTCAAMFKVIASIVLKWIFLPLPVRWSLVVYNALPTIAKGVGALLRGRLDISVLDAAALTILAFRRDFGAMRTILYMFEAAEALESWTRQESRASLAESLAVKIDVVWVKTPTGDVKRPLRNIMPGDLVVIRSGTVIPIDGVVVEGEALVNQSVLTGESDATHKIPGLSVFAGTVVDEGRLVVRAEKTADQTRLQGIIDFIEQSETLKAGVQSKAEQLADAIVPYSLLLSLAVLCITRSPVRAAAVLMVDYSCAIRMSTPLTILSAIREGIKDGVLIKGGKFIEALATADTLVVDKTGTLTMARPWVARVVAFQGWSEREVLRTAACIEEHFPHPVARAVVKKADAENLKHRERHAEPEYIVAHGVASRLDGKQVLVGSAHFIFDDNRIVMSEEARREADAEAGKGRSLLFLAYGGELVGMLAIEDPVRDDCAATLSGLRDSGVDHIAMLTGDGERTARAVAGQLALRDYRSGLLPVDKAGIIDNYKRQGRKVMFVGDGVNDSPALSAADVGVSLKDGADIAKEVAGVVLSDGKLSSLLVARYLAVATLDRINWQFRFIMSVNSLLIALGLAGWITPRIAALLHNLGTVLVTANSIRPLLPESSVSANDSIPMPYAEAVEHLARDQASADQQFDTA